jgi:hypothetical protein
MATRTVELGVDAKYEPYYAFALTVTLFFNTTLEPYTAYRLVGGISFLINCYWTILPNCEILSSKNGQYLKSVV